MTKKETAAPLRVDLYIRVSGQEQAIKGLSLEAQQEDLKEVRQGARLGDRRHLY